MDFACPNDSVSFEEYVIRVDSELLALFAYMLKNCNCGCGLPFQGVGSKHEIVPTVHVPVVKPIVASVSVVLDLPIKKIKKEKKDVVCKPILHKTLAQCPVGKFSKTTSTIRRRAPGPPIVTYSTCDKCGSTYYGSNHYKCIKAKLI